MTCISGTLKIWLDIQTFCLFITIREYAHHIQRGGLCFDVCIYFCFLEECVLSYTLRKDNDWTCLFSSILWSQMLCMFLKWEELSRVPTVSAFRDGGGVAFHTSQRAFSLHPFGFCLEVWTSLNSDSPMGSRSLKLWELGGGCSLFPRRTLLLAPALASTRMNLILPEMVATAAPWEPSMAVPPTLHSHEGCWGFAVPWTPPWGFSFSRWCPSCWGRHHTLRSPTLRDRGQAGSIEKRLCEVSAEHRWILTLSVQERIVGKDEIDPVRCYLFQRYLALSETAILTFHIYHYLCD